MTCPKCGSENVTVQMITEVKMKDKARHGILYWIFIAWWWIPIKWLIFTIPALIFGVLHLAGFGNKQKAVNIQKKSAVCQNCGKSWTV